MFKSTTQPYCRCCGKPIGKWTELRFIRLDAERKKHKIGAGSGHFVFVERYPQSKEDCQKLTDLTVTAVSRSHDKSYITDFHVWDGKSYRDAFFCTNRCAMTLAYGMVQADPNFGTRAYKTAITQKDKAA